ncbi:MAG: replication protein [Ignavibacteriae bacterium]|nr:replication protein [Ignavibacteriota bacterium]
MADIQIDDGNFTRIHNQLLEKLISIKLSGQELQLILYVFRKTFGYAGKHKGDFISLTQIANSLNISSIRAHQILSAVVKLKIIKSSNDGLGSKNFLSFNKDFDTWTTKENLSSNDEKLLSKNLVDIKENLSSTTKKNLSGSTKENLRHKRNKENIKETFKEKDYIDKIIDVFAEKYFESRGINYFKIAKDRKAVGGLLKKVDTNKNLNSEETLKQLKNFFFQCCLIPDQWYRENMSLTLINSKFNEIRSIIRRGNGTYSKHLTQDKLRGIAEDIANDRDLLQK